MLIYLKKFVNNINSLAMSQSIAAQFQSDTFTGTLKHKFYVHRTHERKQLDLLPMLENGDYPTN